MRVNRPRWESRGESSGHPAGGSLMLSGSRIRPFRPSHDRCSPTTYEPSGDRRGPGPVSGRGDSMKLSTALSLVPTLLLVLGGAAASAQDAPGPAPTAADSAEVEAAEDALDYADYTVKAYSLSVFRGNFSGATYLDLHERAPKTEVSIGVGDNLGAGRRAGLRRPLPGRGPGHRATASCSTTRCRRRSSRVRPTAPASASTSPTISTWTSSAPTPRARPSHVHALRRGDPARRRTWSRTPATWWTRTPASPCTSGGLALNYDARPATFLGLVPRIGFGIGGIINRFTVLEDNTSLVPRGQARPDPALR